MKISQQAVCLWSSGIISDIDNLTREVESFLAWRELNSIAPCTGMCGISGSHGATEYFYGGYLLNRWVL